MKARTHYDTLGVRPDASPDEIRRAFRDAARRLHPDVSDAADGGTQFASASAAYEVLSDPAARREYDRQLREQAAGASRAERPATPNGQAHYTWTNIATDSAATGERHVGRADLDEMYDAFFGRARKSGTQPG